MVSFGEKAKKRWEIWIKFVVMLSQLYRSKTILGMFKSIWMNQNIFEMAEQKKSVHNT